MIKTVNIKAANAVNNNSKTAASENEVKQEYQHKDIDLNKCPTSCYHKSMIKGVSEIKENPEKSEYVKKHVDCLIGGALGDALGRPVERVRTPKLYHQYGPNGIQDMATVGLKARITDDTQMTIFTTDGLIKSILKNGKDKMPDMNIIYDSYQDWYKTQTEDAPKNCKKNGATNQIKDLYSPVGPGRTCLASLKGGIPGSIENPINDSDSCGGVMRVAPLGLAYSDPKMAFDAGAQCAALTHCGPEAYLSAGFHSAVVSNLMQGESLEKAFDDAMLLLSTYDGFEKTFEYIQRARELAKTDIDPKVAIESLGYGFKGHEAIAISTYCIFKNPTNLKDALIMSVNHSGDSDSTGAITGNILGTAIGLDTVPKEWIQSLELRREITAMAKDLAEPEKIKNPEVRYPMPQES